MKKKQLEKENKRNEKLRKKGENYTEWQIEKIRKGLFAYKLESIRDGGPPTDLALATAVEASLPGEGNANKRVAEGKKDQYFKIKQEALRRFLAGRPTDPENLPILKNFVIEEGLIEKEEFDEADDTREFLKVHGYIANKNKEIIEKFKWFKGCYEAKRDIGGIIERLTFRFILDPSGLYFRVLERYEDLTEDFNSRGKRPSICEFRRGYAFASTDSNTLHILLRNEDGNNRITLLQVFPETILSNGSVPDSFSLMRGRGNKREFVTEARPEDEPLFFFDIYKYEPIKWEDTGFADIDVLPIDDE